MKSVIKKNRSRSLNIMFADFCYFNRHTLHSQFTPLSIGLIAQYAKQQFGNDIDVSLYKKVDKFLEKASQNPPDVVGLSVYYWNLNQNQYVVNQLRKMFGKNVVIVLGGPCIDTDEKEQYKYLTSVFPNANGLIANEGELGFSNVIKNVLSNGQDAFKNPIEGVVFLKDNQLVKGLQLGLNLDLITMGSPYLSGLMDEFMHSDYQPLIQSSRFCPYTCAFCVSGKNRGKLRGYPIEQVEEEIRFVSKKYSDRPHHVMYLVDENFGILKRDVEIAHIIKKCTENFGFPQSVFFYNDKRFTETSRSVIEILGLLNQYGMCLSLQTENPNTLKAISRVNVTAEQIDDAIKWASERNIPASTELIFGLPHETRDGFIDLMNRSIDRGFDTVKVNNLFVMDGIELNRPAVRKKYGIKTKFRLLGTNYGAHNGNFLAEHEEVVVSSNSFTYEDFLEVRSLNFIHFAVFSLHFQKWFFQFIRNQGVSLAEFFSNFMKPDRNVEWPDGYLDFLDDFKSVAEGELFDSRHEVVAKAEKVFKAHGNDVGDPTRINVNLGARLSYLENKWVKSVLMYHLERIKDGLLINIDRDLASALIDLGERERISLREVEKKEPLNISFDVINWRKIKYKKSLHDLKMPEKLIKFSLDENRTTQVKGFKKRFSSYSDKDYYSVAVDFIQPRSSLLHVLSYD